MSENPSTNMNLFPPSEHDPAETKIMRAFKGSVLVTAVVMDTSRLDSDVNYHNYLQGGLDAVLMDVDTSGNK